MAVHASADKLPRFQCSGQSRKYFLILPKRAVLARPPQKIVPRLRLLRLFSAAALPLLSLGGPMQAQAPLLGPVPLRGWVDMHAHPMAHLAFGGKFLHGAPDVGCLIPADGDCNPQVQAQSMAHALGSCNATHGGHDFFTNPCGDHIRKNLLATLESSNHAQSQHGKDIGGENTDFATWPSCQDISHQTMWVDWIRRAHQHGLRVMVALAVNNATVAAAMCGPGDMPGDDQSSADLQIAEMKQMAARHPDFMEVAYTTRDLRRIVKAGKLALVLGIEIDNIGNFNLQARQGLPITQAQVEAELQRLHTLGVRYVFPIHVIDNPLGGTAVYQDFFNISNYRESGACWELEPAQAEDDIQYTYNPAMSQFLLDILKIKIGSQLSLCHASTPSSPTGQVNAKGLTPLGRHAIQALMGMGMLIDIDHMSQKAANQTLDVAEAMPLGGYPINSGHNGLRSMAPEGSRNENQRTRAQVRRIMRLQGMVGLGWGGDAAGFLDNLHAMLKVAAPKQCAIGTDMNGLITAPPPRMDTVDGMPHPASEVVYDARFPQCCTGRRCWDYNTEGVAHYGLIPDFFQDVRNLGGEREVEALNRSAEGFAEMWERCEAVAEKLRHDR